MHTMSRPIYITRNDDGGYRVKAYKGFVSAPIIRDFGTHAEATAFAMAKLRTKYYSRSCVLDETPRDKP